MSGYDPWAGKMHFLEDEFDELGASKKKKPAKAKASVSVKAKSSASSKPKPKKKRKLGQKIKKGLKKGLKIAATGGLSAVVDVAKKAVRKKVGLPETEPESESASDADKQYSGPELQAAMEMSPRLQAVSDVIAETRAGDMESKGELAQLVAAKLVAALGPPLDAASRALAKMDLQNQATYEHKKLMSDGDFRRQVLSYIGKKAKRGNCACQRTLSALRG